MRFLAAIVESSDDAIIGKTLDGIITSWNNGAQRIYGYTEEEVVGRPISILVPEDRPDEIPSILSRLRRGIRIEHYLTRRKRKDGTIIDVSITISPVKNAQNEIVGASAIAREITERQPAIELEAANEALTDFFAMASHDLRTPTTVIQGFGATLTDAWDILDDDQKKHYLSIMTRQAEHLGSIVTDLAAIATIQSDQVPVDASVVQVRNVVDSIVEGLGGKGEGVQTEIPKTMTLFMDEGHLRRILNNFLTNAWRYGAPPIRVKGKFDGPCVILQVCDQGPGIPDEFVPELFEKFSRLDKAVSKEKGGTGLGLAIVKGLAEANGGTVWYEDNEPTGSCFTVRLPTGS